MESVQELLNRKKLEALEWGAFLEILKEKSKTPVGRAILDQWHPGKLARQEADEMARGILELRVLKEEIKELPPINDYRDLSDVLQRVRRSGAITVAEFRDLLMAQEIAQALHHYLRKNALGKTSLLNSLLGINLLEKWAAKHRNLLDRNGEIADFASPDLGALRSLARELHEKIKNRLQEYLQSPRHSEFLQDFYVTLRDGRYVLPVKSNFKGRFPGIIHDVSNTEQTLFIEPQDIVEWNNQLVVTEKEIRTEIERILAHVVLETEPFVGAFEKNQNIIAKSDVMSAMVEVLDAEGGAACVMEFGEDVEFRGLRHPILAIQRAVVPNSFDFKNGLILTGPNTGGKTVLLKSLGISYLMGQAGFPVYAQSARVHRDLGALFALIGDDQNIRQNLSTFSAHLLALKSILEFVQKGDLVLIDEIASGTSPEEAQPLAQAFIEKLLDRGVRVFVTTHFGALKKFALADARLRIAAMNFDSENKRPSYEIIMDIPGESSAFDTAEQLGLPLEVLERARLLRGEDSKDLSLALRELEKIRKSYRDKEIQLEEKIQRAAEREQKAQRTLEEYGLQSQKRIQEESQKFLKDFQELREKLASQVKAVETKAEEISPQKEAEMQAELEHAQIELRAQLSKKAQKSLSRTSVEEVLNLGSLVEVDGLGIGEIAELPKGLPAQDANALFVISVGGLKTRVARSRLVVPDPDQARLYKSNLASLESQREKKATRLQPASKGATSLQGSRVCDVRGTQLEEALRRIEGAINALTKEGGVVTVIHGIGTGRLRDGIRKYLQKDRADLKFRAGTWPGEGDDGVTLIERDE